MIDRTYAMLATMHDKTFYMVSTCASPDESWCGMMVESFRNYTLPASMKRSWRAAMCSPLARGARRCKGLGSDGTGIRDGKVRIRGTAALASCEPPAIALQAFAENRTVIL